MKIVKVTYTAQAEFVPKNITNIEAVMDGLRKINDPNLFYHTCLGTDGKTFTHTSFFRSEEDRAVLNELPAFKYFQEQLRLSGPEVPPKPEQLTLVGSSRNIFE